MTLAFAWADAHPIAFTLLALPVVVVVCIVALWFFHGLLA